MTTITKEIKNGENKDQYRKRIHAQNREADIEDMRRMSTGEMSGSERFYWRARGSYLEDEFKDMQRPFGEQAMKSPWGEYEMLLSDQWDIQRDYSPLLDHPDEYIYAMEAARLEWIATNIVEFSHEGYTATTEDFGQPSDQNLVPPDGSEGYRYDPEVCTAVTWGARTDAM